MNTQQSPANTSPQKLTLMDLLNAREDRVRHQKALLNAHPGAVLVSMTLNIPGPVKDSPRYRAALETGLHRLKAIILSSEMPSACHILHEEFRPLITGPEAYLVLQPGDGYSDVRGDRSGGGCSDRTDTDFPLDIRKSASPIRFSAVDFLVIPEISPCDISYIIKKAAVSVEEGSDLGRLFDIDVLIPGANDPFSGESAAPGLHDGSDTSHGFDDITGFPRSISRSQIGMKPRRCLLCGEDAKACARSRAHTIEQLLEKIDEILSSAGL